MYRCACTASSLLITHIQIAYTHLWTVYFDTHTQKECIENKRFALVWKWTLMELSKTQNIYYCDEWLSGESFPCPPSWSIGLQWQRLVRKRQNNRFCEFKKLRLPSLSGWYEHQFWAAHNSEGSDGFLRNVEITKRVKWEQIMKVHLNHPMCWGIFVSTDSTIEKPQAWWISWSNPGLTIPSNSTILSKLESLQLSSWNGWKTSILSTS